MEHNTFKMTTTVEGRPNSATQEVSYEDVSQFMGMLYSGNFNPSENPQGPNPGPQPDHQSPAPLPPMDTTGYNPSPRIRAKFSEAAFNQIQSNWTRYCQQQTQNPPPQIPADATHVSITGSVALSGDYFMATTDQSFYSPSMKDGFTAYKTVQYFYLIPNAKGNYVVTTQAHTSDGLQSFPAQEIPYFALKTQLKMFYVGNFPQISSVNSFNKR